MSRMWIAPIGTPPPVDFGSDGTPVTLNEEGVMPWTLIGGLAITPKPARPEDSR